MSRRKAAVRAEVEAWGLGDTTTDPGEVLLRLVSQSAARAQRYAELLARAYDAAERLRAAADANTVMVHTADDGTRPEPPDVQAARADLDRVFTTGGVAALVGRTYSAAHDGSLYATGEAIRGLAQLEAQERDRCAGMAAKAVAAGLAERQVRLAERHGEMIADVLRAVLADPDLGLTDQQRRAVPGVTRRHLSLTG
ncbi:MAG: hypothetical protein ACRD0V_07280 [Acidimicrobiales bacterium]